MLQCVRAMDVVAGSYQAWVLGSVCLHVLVNSTNRKVLWDQRLAFCLSITRLVGIFETVLVHLCQCLVVCLSSRWFWRVALLLVSCFVLMCNAVY